MPHFSCSFAIRSKEVREVPYDMVKNNDQSFVIIPYGINGNFKDISMHRIEKIEIENNISIY